MEVTEEISFDIIEVLPEQVCENIFRNLSGNDLLNASLISSTWYDYIAESQKCMKKIRLSFSKKNCCDLASKKSMDLMKNSTRKYENVELLACSSVYKEVEEILKVPGRQWKDVSIVQVKFPTTLDCIQFLAVFEPTVESLYMDKVYIDSVYYNGLQNQLTFPKLKKLEVKYIQLLLFHKALDSCTNLTELRMSTGDQNHASLQAIHKILRCNKDLKKLSIITNIFTRYFNDNIAKDIEFKLTSFEGRDIYNLGQEHKEHFKQFIETQMSTLETLSVGDWMGLDVVHMFFHMPRLKKFIFRGFHSVESELEWSAVDFHKHSLLETFHLIEVRGRMDILKAFLSATPNVKHLSLYSINNESLVYVSQTLSKLETLTVDIFEATDVSNPNLFIKLTQVSAKVFHNDLKITTSEEKPELSKFEQLVDAKMLEVNPEGRKEKPKRPCCNHLHTMHY